MKKIIHGALFAGVLPLGLGLAGEATASSPYAPQIDAANHLRASAWCLNDHARYLEHKVYHLKRKGVNPVRLQHKAQVMRRQATHLARASNRVAKNVFDHGYRRPTYQYYG